MSGAEQDASRTARGDPARGTACDSLYDPFAGQHTDHGARSIYLREGAVTPALGEWILTLFNPKHVDDPCRLLAEAERKLKKYRRHWMPEGARWWSRGG